MKFSSKMDPEVLEELRQYAKKEGRTVASMLSEAVRAYLDGARVRPAVRAALDDVMDEHDELLTRLAK